MDGSVTTDRVDRAALSRQWCQEGHYEEIAEFRQLVEDSTKTAWRSAGRHWDRDELNEGAWQEAARAFPPLDNEGAPGTDSQSESAHHGRVVGLGDIPASWGTLPANASLQSELNWVQANRLVVVDERPSGATRVHLDRARSPAPSRAALGWLETSIRDVEVESRDNEPTVANADSQVEVADMLERLDDGASSADLARDVRWVYSCFERRNMQASDAPSSGAWAMLQWARSARNRFFEVVLPKALTTKDRDADEQEKIQHDKKNVQQIRQVLARFVETSKPVDLDKAVTDLATQWCDTHGVKVTPEAREKLEEGVSKLVANYRVQCSIDGHAIRSSLIAQLLSDLLTCLRSMARPSWPRRGPRGNPRSCQ